MLFVDVVVDLNKEFDMKKRLLIVFFISISHHLSLISLCVIYVLDAIPPFFIYIFSFSDNLQAVTIDLCGISFFFPYFVDYSNWSSINKESVSIGISVFIM